MLSSGTRTRHGSNVLNILFFVVLGRSLERLLACCRYHFLDIELGC